MDQILVTGAAGFIGSHIVEELIKKGELVLGLDNFCDYYDPRIKENNLRSIMESESFTIIRGDIRDSGLLECIFSEHDIKSVIHLAAMVGVRNSVLKPIEYVDVNVGGTTALLDRAVKSDVTNFIIASSSSVYGNITQVPFRENYTLGSPESPYAVTKQAVEAMAYTYHSLYEIPITCLRFFTVYGPRGRPDMAPFKFIDSISKGIPIQQFGDGSSSRDYTYISDIVQGIIAATETPFEYEIINLGGSNPVFLRDFIKAVEDAVGKPALIEQLPNQPGDMFVTLADISKAEKLLGYLPKVSLKEGLEETVEWYNKNY